MKHAGSEGPLCRVWELNRKETSAGFSHTLHITPHIIKINTAARNFPFQHPSYTKNMILAQILLSGPTSPPQCIFNGAERLQTATWGAQYGFGLLTWRTSMIF